METESKKKRRYKKKDDNFYSSLSSQLEDQKKQQKQQTQQAQQAYQEQQAQQQPEKPSPTIISIDVDLPTEAKKYLDMDISSMSAATQKKNKLYLNSLKQAITLLKSGAPSSDLYKVYLGVNAQRLQKNAQIVQNKYNKVPLEQDRAVAKEAYETSLKRFNDKDKFQKILVDKGNKINQEMKDINARAIEERNQIIKEAEDYAKNLQKKQQEEMPEKQKLIDENARLHKELEAYLMEGLKIKGELDKQLKGGESSMKKLTGGGDMQKVMEGLAKSAQINALENHKLQEELMGYERNNLELEKFVKMVDDNIEKVKKEMTEKQNESVLLMSDNEEIKMRIKSRKMNKEILQDLLKEYEKGNAKIKTMTKLKQKYKEQEEELQKELFPEKFKKKEDEGEHEHDHDGCCGHEHAHEHKHEHAHEHEDEPKDVKELENKKEQLLKQLMNAGLVDKKYEETGCGDVDIRDNDDIPEETINESVKDPQQKKIDSSKPNADGFSISHNEHQFGV